MTPKFQPEPVELQGIGTAVMLPAYLECEACGERALRDGATKLCRACWRAMVLSPSGAWGYWSIKPCETCGYPSALCLSDCEGSKEAHRLKGHVKG